MSRKATRPAWSTRWRAASVPTTSRARTRVVAGGRRRHLGGRRTEERGQLLGRPGHADPQRLQPGRVADRAHHRPTLAAAPADQVRTRAVLGDGAAAPGAAGQLAARPAGQEPDATGAVQHAHHPAVRTVEFGTGRRHQPLGEEPGAGVVTGAVHDLDHRPPPPLHCTVGRDHGPPLGEGERRARARPGPPAPRRAGPARARRRPTTRSGPAPPGGPRRGRRAPRPPPAARSAPRRRHGSPRPRSHPAAAADQPSGSTATGTPAARRRAARCSARWPRGGDHQDPVGTGAADQLQDQQGRVERRGEADDGRAADRPGRRRPGPPSRRPATPGGSVGAGAGPRSRTTRAGDAVPRNDDTGPAQRHAAQSASVDHRGGRADAARRGQLERGAPRGRA